jgi:hypothetical protein
MTMLIVGLLLLLVGVTATTFSGAGGFIYTFEETFIPLKIAGYRTPQFHHLEKGTVRSIALKLHENNDEEEISTAQLFHAAAHCAIAQHRVSQHLAATSPGHPRHRGRPHRDIDLNLFLIRIFFLKSS